MKGSVLLAPVSFPDRPFARCRGRSQTHLYLPICSSLPGTVAEDKQAASPARDTISFIARVLIHINLGRPPAPFDLAPLFTLLANLPTNSPKSLRSLPVV